MENYSRGEGELQYKSEKFRERLIKRTRRDRDGNDLERGWNLRRGYGRNLDTT